MPPVPDRAIELKVTFCVQGAISPLLANIYLDPLDTNRETVSMKKPPTGEPYAGKPPVRLCVQ